MVGCGQDISLILCPDIVDRVVAALKLNRTPDRHGEDPSGAVIAGAEILARIRKQ